MASWLDWQGNALIRRPNGGSNPLGAIMKHHIQFTIPNAGPIFIFRVENKQCVVCGKPVDFSHIFGLVDDLGNIPRVCGQEHSDAYMKDEETIQTT